MTLSKLNKRIKIVEPGELVDDGMGGFVEGEGREFSVWGSARQLSQKEILLYGMETNFISYEFMFRVDAVRNITQAFKIKYKNMTFRIISIIEKEEKRRFFKVVANEQK